MLDNQLCLVSVFSTSIAIFEAFAIEQRRAHAVSTGVFL